MQNRLEEVKGKYYSGYRCIYKDSQEKQCTYHLRDFNKGKIHTVTTSNLMEIGEIDNFLEELDAIKKKQGHDCFCTGYETD